MPNAIPGPDDITRRVLPNGIVVLVRENFDAQSVVIDGSFAGGALFENPERHGVASLTADVLMHGTQNRDFSELHETLESSGMSLDVEGGRHLASFGGKALAEDLPTLLDLLADVLKNPAFPPDHVELVKGQIITGLQYNQQDTRYMAGKKFRQLTYPADHIYNRGSTGEIETVSALTADDLHAFHQGQYGPGAMIVAIVGAVEAEAAIDALSKALGDWENPNQKTDFSLPDVPKPKELSFEAVDLPGKTQSDIVLGVPGPNRKAEDYQAARLVNNVLGVFGMMGRLGASVREEKGLAYYSYSSLEGGLGPGAWSVSAGVNPQNMKLAVDSIREELERIIREPVSAEDLADNQANLTGRLPLLLESNSGVAGNLLSMERYQLGLDYLRKYTDIINSLTVEELRAAMRHYWKPDAFTLTVAGPALKEKVI
jgi:zinc protease